jgi:sortase A
MKILRIERFLLSIGLAFLAIWSIVWSYRNIASRVAIERFRTEDATKPKPRASSFVDSGSVSIVDFRLWSAQRIDAYRDLLYQKFDVPLAVLRIPRIGLDVPMFNGADELNLNRGVARILGTARPGHAGNLGIAGHRDGFFRGLKDLERGDVVELNRPGQQRDRYIVSQTRIVKPDDVSVLASTPEWTLTLVTCFPFYYVGSAPDRYVVTAIRSELKLAEVKSKQFPFPERSTNDQGDEK